MKKMLVLGLAAALCSAAMAYPTLTGPTGLATLPNADVVPAGQFQVAADWYNTDEDATIPVRALYGFGGNFEFGASYILNDASDFLGLNAKWVTPLTLGGFAWAAGAQWLDAQDGDLTQTQLYFVGTRNLTEGDDTMPAMTGTLGLNWTKLEDAVDDVDDIRLFAGLNAAFANDLRLSAEFQTEGDVDTDALWSVVARYPFTPALMGQVGFTNAFGLSGGDDNNVFAGVAYTFGAAE